MVKKIILGMVSLMLVLVSSPLHAQTPTQTPTITPIPFVDPPGCLEPTEDYTRIEVNGSILNRRTLLMLEHAKTLYDGPIDLTNLAITQGGYTGGALALSFGTHDGGGSVDISVRNLPTDWSIRWDDIPVLLTALRTAGFAAWFRDEADGMTPHIHAIAVGDDELSYAAQLQLTGRYGYFRGYDALPQADGVPQPDDGGEMILCEWMLEQGYADLREEVEITLPPYTFVAGDQAYVNTLWGEELNLRENAGTGYPILLKMSPETPVTVLDGPVSANGFRWWQLETEDGTIGWAADTIEGTLTLVK